MAQLEFSIEVAIIHEDDLDGVIKAFDLDIKEIDKYRCFQRYFDSLDDDPAALISEWILYHQVLRKDMIDDWAFTISGWAATVDQEMKEQFIIGIKGRMERIVRKFHETKETQNEQLN